MPEKKEAPTELVDLVSTAFLVDIANLTSQETRDEAWEALGKQSEFGDVISKFRGRLKDGYKREAQAGPAGMFFVMLKDRNLASLMKYLTISLTRPVDDRDATVMRDNTDKIVSEMGFEHIHDTRFRELTLNDAVSKILDGSVTLDITG